VADDDLKRVFEAIREFRETAERIASDSRYQIDVTVEHFNGRFDALAETIAGVNESLGRRIAAVEERIESGFADTQR